MRHFKFVINSAKTFIKAKCCSIFLHKPKNILLRQKAKKTLFFVFKMLINQFQFQAQKLMQLQQLQQMLIAQNMVSKPPKTARFQKSRTQSSAVQTAPAQDNENFLPNRRILAVNLPKSLQNVEAVAGIFYPYGDATVQILKPGKTLPDDVTPYVEKVPDIGRSFCAIIDLETSRAAKFAVHVLRRREEKLGFRLGMLKAGIEEKLYEQKCLTDFFQAEKNRGL